MTEKPMWQRALPDKIGIWAYGGYGEQPRFQYVTYYTSEVLNVLPPINPVIGWYAYLGPVPTIEMPYYTPTDYDALHRVPCEVRDAAHGTWHPGYTLLAIVRHPYEKFVTKIDKETPGTIVTWQYCRVREADRPPSTLCVIQPKSERGIARPE